uniref:RGS domain-containing protein n=1 Tax=Parascaris univalens TaxID=6257 RepID=A0A914ZVA8_PARUN
CRASVLHLYRFLAKRGIPLFPTPINELAERKDRIEERAPRVRCTIEWSLTNETPS